MSSKGQRLTLPLVFLFYPTDFSAKAAAFVGTALAIRAGGSQVPSTDASGGPAGRVYVHVRKR